ncbi:uncharacterized protein Dwil_GK18034, isoform A [Drosophila willistoni]|uniref:Uncharacterized protein, isoform A n=1 Tax=Drosophila willistoni TaxID=7260 RepID=B4N6C7_DROWI|nr:hippocampus abundant transcript 1 protein isoform X2 [Drosophila willistoni]EDW79916.1 uncharacterized protein Dwil_GK18034, isoform A [Drosophila willistoni]
MRKRQQINDDEADKDSRDENRFQLDDETETEIERERETDLNDMKSDAKHIIRQSDQDQDSGEQTETQSTHSSSSTPTTADVADVETVSSLPLSPIPAAPVTSTTPATSTSSYVVRPGHLLKRFAPSLRTNKKSNCKSSSGGDHLANLDNVPTTSCYAATAHPSAAFAETALASTVAASSGSSCSGSRPCGGGGGGAGGGALSGGTSSSTHRRTHSAASYISMRSQGGVSETPVPQRNRFFEWLRVACNICCCKSSGIGEPSVHHALVVIFLEFFAWGLLTMPIISTLNQTFPDHTFLMNGLVMGIKGILSFLSAPLIGALSDIWGRKFFLLVTVFFTCLPIPLMSINTWWFFAMISISGAFAVTFSVVFAYVADVTTPEERSKAYGLASATFAASLVISPALGNALMDMYGGTLVVALSTAIALLDVFFILVAVPESLSEKVRPASWGAPISWEQADPFLALRKVGTDKTVLMLCLTVLLSYLPEAGEYSCMFVYLKLKMGFNYMEVSVFIAIVGILSITVQVTLGSFMKVFGAKRTIIVGLALEIVQLLWYGFGSQKWMMWSAGVVAALGSITYPAISAFVSLYAAPESQGAVQGMITGMRGLCNGLGPAVFGVIFYLFNVDLNDDTYAKSSGNRATNVEKISQHIPGPPFVFGALCVFCAIIVSLFIPEGQQTNLEKKRASLDVQYEIETGHKAPSSLAPLIRSDSLAQL